MFIYKSNKRIILLLCVFVSVFSYLLFGLNGGIAYSATTEQVNYPYYACTDGKMIYYAVGLDHQGGKLYMYNPETKKQRLISNLSCSQLCITSYNIYCTVNNNYGTDGSDRFIYKMSKDGSKVKKLASGYSPVVIGKYVYYIAVKKQLFSDGVYRETESIGIYRMDSNGGQKKCIRKFDSKFGTNRIMAGKDRIIAKNYVNSKLYAMSLSGGLKRIDATSNMRITTTFDNIKISNNIYGYSYSSSGNALIKHKGTAKKVIYRFPKNEYGNGTISSITDLGKYLFVTTGMNAYVLTKDGTNVKRVAIALMGN